MAVSPEALGNRAELAAASLGSAIGHPVEAAESSRRAHDAHVRGTRRSASVPARSAEDAPNPVCGIPPPKLTPAACLALVTNLEVRVADGTDHMVLTVPRDLLDKNLRVGITVTYPKGIFRSGLARLSSGRISFEGNPQAFTKGVRLPMPLTPGTHPHQWYRQPAAQPPEDSGAAAAEPVHERSRRARRRANRAPRAAIETAAPPLQQTRGPPAADLATGSASSTGMARSPAPMSSCAMPMSVNIGAETGSGGLAAHSCRQSSRPWHGGREPGAGSRGGSGGGLAQPAAASCPPRRAATARGSEPAAASCPPRRPATARDSGGQVTQPPRPHFPLHVVVDVVSCRPSTLLRPVFRHYHRSRRPAFAVAVGFRMIVAILLGHASSAGPPRTSYRVHM